MADNQISLAQFLQEAAPFVNDSNAVSFLTFASTLISTPSQTPSQPITMQDVEDLMGQAFSAAHFVSDNQNLVNSSNNSLPIDVTVTKENYIDRLVIFNSDTATGTIHIYESDTNSDVLPATTINAGEFKIIEGSELVKRYWNGVDKTIAIEVSTGINISLLQRWARF